jgi:hypothetical protein
MSEWMQQVRQKEASAPARPVSRPRSPVRTVAALLVLAAVGIAAVDWMTDQGDGRAILIRGVVQSSVLDAEGQPIDNALIFVASAPKIHATTGHDGGFLLKRVPGGKQVVVVVVDEIGQEFEVAVEHEGVNEAGPLVYCAPRAR